MAVFVVEWTFPKTYERESHLVKFDNLKKNKSIKTGYILDG